MQNSASTKCKIVEEEQGGEGVLPSVLPSSPNATLGNSGRNERDAANSNTVSSGRTYSCVYNMPIIVGALAQFYPDDSRWGELCLRWRVQVAGSHATAGATVQNAIRHWRNVFAGQSENLSVLFNGRLTEGEVADWVVFLAGSGQNNGYVADEIQDACINLLNDNVELAEQLQYYRDACAVRHT